MNIKQLAKQKIIHVIFSMVFFIVVLFPCAYANNIELISVDVNGIDSSNFASRNASITPDGRFVVFESSASNLVSNDTNIRNDVFVRDRETGVTRLVSVNLTGTSSENSSSSNPFITPDGRYVFFESSAGDLIVNDNTIGVTSDIFVRDLLENTTTLVSQNISGQGSGVFFPDLFGANDFFTPDGRFVVYVSNSFGIVNSQTNFGSEIFLRDLIANKTSLVSINLPGTSTVQASSSGPSITPNGRFVVFVSTANNLVANDTDAGFSAADIFVRDLENNITILVSANIDNTGSGNGASTNPHISADGRYVFFLSEANNLVTNDMNSGIFGTDIFMRDLVTGTTELVSVNLDGFASGNISITDQLDITPDGRFVVFASSSEDLVEVDDSNDNSSDTDIFVRDMVAKKTSLVSISKDGKQSGNFFSTDPSITPDGRFVVFNSHANNLVANDKTQLDDIFVRDLVTNTTILLSINEMGDSNGSSRNPSITPDGGFVVFQGFADNLVENDSNFYDDVFVSVDFAVGVLGASVLPSGRSVQVGQAATAFASIANQSRTGIAQGCGISPITSVPATFVYQTTDPATNLLTGTVNTPIDIIGGGFQSYFFAFDAVTNVLPPTNVELSFDCLNTEPARVFAGFNTFLLSASAISVPDIIALTTGLVDVKATGGISNFFGIASVNLGATGDITVTPDAGSLPVVLSICETDQATGGCKDINQVRPSTTFNYAANSTASFAVFYTATAPIPFDTVNNRVFIRFTDSSGELRGVTSVSLSTQ